MKTRKPLEILPLVRLEDDTKSILLRMGLIKNCFVVSDNII